MSVPSRSTFPRVAMPGVRSRAGRLRRALTPLLAVALLSSAPAAATAAPLPQVTVTAQCQGVVTLPADVRSRLIALTDPATVTTLPVGLQNMEVVAAELVSRGDRRGIFALFYRNILRSAVPALQTPGAFRDQAWSERVSYAFFRRYLLGINASLRGTTIPPVWSRFYRMAADCSVRPGRVALAGLDAHLILDFPDAIAEARTTTKNFADYWQIGTLLQSVTEQIGDELAASYGADLREFFHLWAFGNALDAATADGVTTTLLFQGIRTLAFSYGVALRNPLSAGSTRLAMAATFAAAEAVADALARKRLI